VLSLDGSEGEGGGQVLRAALALSAGTGQPFEIKRIRERRPRPGLRPQHLAAVRAVSLACQAEVHGAFEGSPDLRFTPRQVQGGDYRLELGAAGPATLLLETVAPVLARAETSSTIAIEGGTHVPLSPSLEFVARHWSAAVSGLGIDVAVRLERAGFARKGGGELRARITPARRPGALYLEERGRLVSLHGVSGVGRLALDVAVRQRDAAQQRLWEARRLEAEWEVLDVPAASPGSFLYVEAVFEGGRGGFSFLGEKGVRPELLGDRAARRLLRFLGDEQGAVDGHLADQLVVPLALSGGGGRVTTTEVTGHLEAVAALAARFGVPARTWGRVGGPGGVEVERVDSLETAG
jgi:RNA 3'-terminal phosphate cyclase (ATP)